MKHTRLLVLMLCIVLACTACGAAEEDPPTPTDASGEEIHVEMPAPQAQRVFTASELSRLFENSRTEANELMDAVVQVTGVARFVEGGLSLDRDTQYGYIVCKMSDYSKDYSKVQRGDTVVVVGTLTAEFAYIYLENCYYLGTTDSVAPAAPGPTPAPGGTDEGTLFGGWERLEFQDLGDGRCVLRYRIHPGWNNEATIHQNYYAVQEFIQSEGGNAYKEIQYFGLMDMGNGHEEIVISFKLGEALIQEVFDGSRPAPLFGAYASELWVHENLRLDPVPQGPQQTPQVLITTPTPTPPLLDKDGNPIPEGSPATDTGGATDT